MAVLEVLKLNQHNYDYNGSCLRIPSIEIELEEFGSEWLKRFIFDMFDTLYSYPSGVGLAANQVGFLKKICVVDIKRDGKKPLVLINPHYNPTEDEMVESQEVCLSFPNVSSIVKRFKKIEVEYQDFYGERKSIVAEGFKAYVFQHEIDHLNGIVHVDISKPEEILNYDGYSYRTAISALNVITGGD